MSDKIIINPPIKSLLLGIRSIGYTFSSALADIIDNSISAEAKSINILSDPAADEPYFQVIDDGCGMNMDELKNAITLGSNRSDKTDKESELGRFGLGLKTATLSQCKSLTVISKKFGKVRAIEFDVDSIEKSNAWEIRVLTNEEISIIHNVEILNEYNSGTIVMWKKFDKIEISADDFVHSFRKIINEAKKHCEFVFHRFYDQIDIKFFHKKIEKRDPFLTKFYPKTQIGKETEIRIPNEPGYGVIVPYTLPFSNQLTQEEKALLGDPKSIYDEQGFYIYRNKRLIVWGSWLRMGIRSELNKHSRVLIDIPSCWDHIWALDVKKSSAKIPDVIKEKVKLAVEDTIVKSAKIVKGKGSKESASDILTWNKLKYRDGTKYEINRDNPLLLEIMTQCDLKTKKLINLLLNQIETYLPQFRIVSDNAESIQIYNKPCEMNDDEIETKFWDTMKIFGFEEKIMEILLHTEEFHSLIPHKNKLIERLRDERK